MGAVFIIVVIAVSVVAVADARGAADLRRGDAFTVPAGRAG
jgi:hypothetical protein